MFRTPALALALLVAIAPLVSVAGCDDPVPFAPGLRDGGPPPICEGVSAGLTCVRDVAYECDDRGTASAPDDCAARGERCVEGRGCGTCVPNEVRCDGETVEVCDPTGSTWSRGNTCDASAGLRCSTAGCVDLCARAAEDRSYVGCEYWPVVTRNGALQSEFTFAVAVANPQLVPALVVIDRGGEEIARRTIAPGALELVPLPWVDALRLPASGLSVRVPDGAYHLVSDVPVVVTQFNPLEYRLERDCTDEPPESEGDGVCHSFTNDASLLLPAHVLTGSYVVVSRPTMVLGVGGEPAVSTPGFVTIVGAEDAPVMVEIASSAHASGSADGTITTMAPGDVRTFELARGEVLQLASAIVAGCPGRELTETYNGVTYTYCDPGADHDLTGTIVRANGRVAVISGHDCSFVPFDRWACDHLEEQLFPVESLGRSAVVAATHSLRREPNLLRVVSAAEGNAITFVPPIAPPITLGLGAWTEIELREGVRVEGTGALLAAVFLVGQDHGGIGSAGRLGTGDPAMALAIPDAQYRRSYAFLAPDTYAQSWIDVVAPTGMRVVLDSTVIGGWREITGTGWSTASVRIEPGVHLVDGARPFGVQVYGFGAYTSYLVPGGLDLRPITPPI